MNFRFWAAFLLLTFSSCQDDPSDEMPNTPEEVLKEYQKFFDKNEFEQAKRYSTPTGRRWIDDIAPMIMSEEEESTIMTTIFHSIDCVTKADTAICDCKLQDANEFYTASYRIVKINGQWLVDAPDEEETIDYEDNEEIIEEFFGKEGTN